MDANLFLEQFDHLAQSPDGVQKLRNLVLELAVRGHLVQQDPTDEPTSDLLKRIEAEKANLVRAGEIKKAGTVTPITQSEIWLENPLSWNWIRLIEIGYFTGGGTPSMLKGDYWNGNIIWISPKDMKTDYVDSSEMTITEKALEETSAKRIPINSLLIVARSGILKRLLPVAINTQECAVNQDIKVLVPYYKPIVGYLRVMLKGFERHILTHLVKTGTTVQSLKYDEFANYAFPLPPLAEQHRIVAKVDELMQLCDQLEQEQNQRDQLRQHAAKSTLHHLTAASTKAETFHYWQQTEQHFAQLFDRASTVADLRAAILELAVRGRLVPQDPHDEPASELLKRIETEKANLFRAGQLKKSEKLPPLAEDKKPYQLPQGWEWATATEFCNSVTSGSTPSSNEMFSSQDDQAEIPFLKVYNLTHDGSLNFPYRSTFIRRDTHTGQLNRSRTYPGDVLMNIVGPPLGKISLVPNTYPEWNINQAIVSFSVSPLTNNKYFCYLLLAPNTIDRFVATSKATTNQFNLSVTTCRTLPFPIPPLAEQVRIMSKIDELMQLCDQLEQQADQTHELSAKLMDSIAFHLFEPATAI